MIAYSTSKFKLGSVFPEYRFCMIASEPDIDILNAVIGYRVVQSTPIT